MQLNFIKYQILHDLINSKDSTPLIFGGFQKKNKIIEQKQYVFLKEILPGTIVNVKYTVCCTFQDCVFSNSEYVSRFRDHIFSISLKTSCCRSWVQQRFLEILKSIQNETSCKTLLSVKQCLISHFHSFSPNQTSVMGFCIHISFSPSESDCLLGLLTFLFIFFFISLASLGYLWKKRSAENSSIFFCSLPGTCCCCGSI